MTWGCENVVANAKPNIVICFNTKTKAIEKLNIISFLHNPKHSIYGIIGWMNDDRP